MTLLIKNVAILGGAEKYSELRDIFISGDKISAIGSFPSKGADEVIEGRGAYLSPGFIDVNTDSDHYLTLFNYPQQDDFLRQGVTTIIGGACGASLAPLLYGSLESLQKWGDISKVNVNWHSVQELFSALERRPLAVNFGTLIGHSTIRRAITGPEIRDLTKNEMEIFGGTLRRALHEGGLGLSTGLSYVHSFKTPFSELKFLVALAKECGGIYTTHVRKNGPELPESIDETIKLAKEASIKTIVSHFMPLLGAEKEYEAALAKIESLPAETDFRFDMYPFDTSILAVYTFLPLWVQSGGREVMLANVRDAWMHSRIEKDILLTSPKDFVVAQAPGNDFLVGKSLVELCDVFNTPDYRTALLKLMMVTELKAIVFYKNINNRFIKRAMASSRSLIASNAASFSEPEMKSLKNERATSTFTKFLSMVESEKLLQLEEAVKKITLEPARLFNLAGRGIVKEGGIADLAIFSFSETAGNKKEASVKHVIVGGVTVFKDNQFAGMFPGKILKRSDNDK